VKSRALLPVAFVLIIASPLVGVWADTAEVSDQAPASKPTEIRNRALESRINSLERRIVELEGEIRFLEDKVKNLDRRIDDLRYRHIQIDR
jgi:predicted  nucleic acid-binding Zn-ribbon protein